MNYEKAQQEVFKALISGQRVCKFDIDAGHTFITPDGFRGWSFPNDVLMVNVEKITQFKGLEIDSLVKPENELKITLDFKLSSVRSKELLRKFESKTKYVYVKESFLKYFQNARYYQAFDNPIGHIVVTELVKGTECPVGVVLPVRIYDEHTV